MNEARTYPSDEGYCDDQAPVLSVFMGGNLDWYLAIEWTERDSKYTDEPHRKTIAVRITTSGQRVPGICKAILDLYEVLGTPEAKEPVLGEEWLKWSMEQR